MITTQFQQGHESVGGRWWEGGGIGTSHVLVGTYDFVLGTWQPRVV